MPTPVQMPKIGLTMTEGQIVEWKKNEGDQVKKGEILFVFETEKVTYEVEAPESGILHKILHSEGSTAKVSEVVAVIVQPGEEVEEVAEPKAAKKEELQKEKEKPAATEPSAEKKIMTGSRLKAAPVAKKMARAHGLNLSNITGTGFQGRILKKDVESFLERRPAEGQEERLSGREETLRITGMRRTIAKKMLASKVEAAQAYMANDLDASQVIALRKTLMEEMGKEEETKVTITDVMMFIAAKAIKQHPVINTRWSEDGISYYHYIHMGMAMMLKDGLIVPVVWDIDQKSIWEIAEATKDLVEKGRGGKLTPDEMKGSTFTLSSMGMLGIQFFTPIINQPENAILGVGTITKKPAVQDDQIVIKPMMNVALTYDHRTIDGAEAAKFMRTLKKFIENPYLAFTSKSMQ